MVGPNSTPADKMTAGAPCGQRVENGTRNAGCCFGFDDEADAATDVKVRRRVDAELLDGFGRAGDDAVWWVSPRAVLSCVGVFVNGKDASPGKP